MSSGNYTTLALYRKGTVHYGKIRHQFKELTSRANGFPDKTVTHTTNTAIFLCCREDLKFSNLM